jgi:hypothetical protein
MAAQFRALLAAMTRFLMCFALIAACGPGRTSYQRYPGAPATFDKAGSDPKAVEIAEKVFATAGGTGNWDKAKQIRWRQIITTSGKLSADGEHAWDRWNGRHMGRLNRPDGSAIIVGYSLYAEKAIGFQQDKGEKEIKHNLDEANRTKYVGVAKSVFNQDTAIMTMQFLMLEPGAKLAYVGQAKDDAGKDHYDELKVTFADPLRSELEFHPIIDRNTNEIQRIEVMKVGATMKIGYVLKDWTTAGGLKFASSRQNLGDSNEITTIKDVKVSDPDDNLFIAPLH